MTGRRIDGTKESFKSGDYGRDSQGEWYARPPWKRAGGSLSGHEVIEHEDGTITASPSILIELSFGTWHGYLERGQWRVC